MIQAFLQLPTVVQILIILIAVVFASYGLYVTYGIQQEGAKLAENTVGIASDVTEAGRTVVSTTGSTAANVVSFAASGFKNQNCPSGYKVSKNKGPYATAGKCKQKNKDSTCVRRGVAFRPCIKK